MPSINNANCPLKVAAENEVRGLQVGGPVLGAGCQVIQKKCTCGTDHPEDDRNRGTRLIESNLHASLRRRIAGSCRWRYP